jgi:acetyl-CoA C-acetyltransferase
MAEVYILGGAQTDFGRNWSRENLGLYDMFKEVLMESISEADIEPMQIEVGHVGNFVGELFTGQGLLGGFFGHVYDELADIPTARHEAACASGSLAIMAAMRDIEAGHYDIAAAVGLELMRNVDGKTGADYLGAATWKGREALDASYPWPYMFDLIAQEYDLRYGINTDYLKTIGKINFANGKVNPKAQTRNWNFPAGSFSNDDELNPVIEGCLRKLDCGQITDGAACVILASEKAAKLHAAKHGLKLKDIPRIKSWAHRSAPLLLEHKLALSKDQSLLFPHINKMFADLLRRGNFKSITELGGLETHDCFTVTEYMAIDHCGLTEPGESWKAIEEGVITKDGLFPINPSGGLMGLGHPVGATGVRMLLDCANQVTNRAGKCQIDAIEDMATFNVGGSTTTCASFIVGVA